MVHFAQMEYMIYVTIHTIFAAFRKKVIKTDTSLEEFLYFCF